MKKQEQFHKELKELLKKFNAEIVIEDFSYNAWCEDNKIVVDFYWDSENEDEPTPQLVLGIYEDGDL